MAIGSGAEIGVTFGLWRDMNGRERDLWCATFRDRFGDDLLKGYATLNYPNRRGNNMIIQQRLAVVFERLERMREERDLWRETAFRLGNRIAGFNGDDSTAVVVDCYEAVQSGCVCELHKACPEHDDPTKD